MQTLQLHISARSFTTLHFPDSERGRDEIAKEAILSLHITEREYVKAFHVNVCVMCHCYDGTEYFSPRLERSTSAKPKQLSSLQLPSLALSLSLSLSHRQRFFYG